MTLLDEQLGDKYEVLEKVRVGGMGAIYKVRHRLLDEIRIVKVIRRPGAEVSSADRFLREARPSSSCTIRTWRSCTTFAVGADGQALHRHGVHRGLEPAGAPPGYGRRPCG